MAFTNPDTRSHGYPVTADDWNLLVTNEIDLNDRLVDAEDLLSTHTSQISTIDFTNATQNNRLTTIENRMTYRFKAEATSSQTTSVNSNYGVVLHSVTQNVGGFTTNTTDGLAVSVPVAGWYFLNSQIAFSSISAGENEFFITIDGTAGSANSAAYQSLYIVTGEEPPKGGLQLSAYVNLSANSTIRLRTYTAGGAASLRAAGSFGGTWLSIVRDY